MPRRPSPPQPRAQPSHRCRHPATSPVVACATTPVSCRRHCHERRCSHSRPTRCTAANVHDGVGSAIRHQDTERARPFGVARGNAEPNQRIGVTYSRHRSRPANRRPQKKTPITGRGSVNASHDAEPYRKFGVRRRRTPNLEVSSASARGNAELGAEFGEEGGRFDPPPQVTGGLYSSQDGL